MTHMRYKFKIGEVVKIKSVIELSVTEPLNNKIGCIIERQHADRKLQSNQYRVVVCGIPDYPIWFYETNIERIE